MLVHPQPGGLFGVVGKFPDVIKEAVDHIVVKPLEPVIREAQQIEERRVLIEPFQPVDGVIQHERGVVPDAFVRDTQFWQQLLRQAVEVAHLFSPRYFPFDFSIGKVPGVAFQSGDLVQAFRIAEEISERFPVGRSQTVAHDFRQAVLFKSECRAHYVLQRTVFRRDDTFFFQEARKLPEDVEGFSANCSGLSCFFFQSPTLRCVAVSVAEQTEYESLLFESRSFCDTQIFQVKAWKIFFP